MSPSTGARPVTATENFGEDRIGALLQQEEIAYRRVPHQDPQDGPGPEFIWRVHLDPVAAPGSYLALEINGEVTLGRDKDGPGHVDLTPYDSEPWTVSRRHIMLRPSDTNLFVTDLGSTNGTLHNGRPIGVQTPYSISNGDLLSLGRVEFVVRVIKRPKGHTALLQGKADLSEALVEMARAITSQLELADVFGQALELARSLTAADEAAVWLVDEHTNELLLEAEVGVERDGPQSLRLPVRNSMAGEVVLTGESNHVTRGSSEEKIKLETGHLVEDVIYAPLTLGGVTFGALMAAHREPTGRFDSHDERALATIADFGAIAVHNARIYQAADTALARRVKEMNALNHAVSHDLRNLLNSVMGYAGLLQMTEGLDEESLEIADGIIKSAKSMSRLIGQMLDLMTLSEAPQANNAACDLLAAVSNAVIDMEGAAAVKSIQLEFFYNGNPYPIQGNSLHLYRSVLNLVDNAIKYSSEGASVTVSLDFGENDITVKVRDTGPGIPEEDLPHIFDRFFRGKQAARNQTGVGLGLALVQATIEAHRGTITARNAEDQGMEFTITLPATPRGGPPA